MAQARWSATSLIRLAPLLALLLACVFAGPQAEAQQNNGWKLCNDTSFVLEAATGRPEGRGVIVEGWVRIRPGECQVAVRAPLRPGVMFVFSRSSNAHRSGQRTFRGDVPLCVDPRNSFSTDSPANCSGMGLVRVGFKPVNITNRDSWTTHFREAEDYDQPGQSAQSAGLQRLLDDAGVDTVPVDGYLGRRSRGAIDGFLAQRRLPAARDNEYWKVIDILEDVARHRSLDVGMMLCNRTSNRIWTAIARRRSEGWESRGWWSLNAGDCVRTVDEALISTPHYVYAEMETVQGNRLLIGAQAIFCTSARSVFAIVGRERCAERQYRDSAFIETATPEDGKLVYEFFDRSFGVPQPNLN
jgi:uncharacterized membrane protein